MIVSSLFVEALLNAKLMKWTLFAGGGTLLGALLGYLARCVGST